MTTAAQDAHALANRLDTEAASCSVALTGFQTELDEKDASIAAYQVQVAQLVAQVNALTPSTLWGCAVPNTANPWADLDTFETRTGPLDIVRAYPGPKYLTASLNQAATALTRKPGRGIIFNPHIAGQNFTDAQLIQFAKDIEAIATKVPFFGVAPDAEPDRTDRPYTTAVFISEFIRFSIILAQYAPHAVMILNLTGFNFAQRIGDYAALLPYYTILAVDIYWELKDKGVKANLDFTDAAGWAKNNGKRFGGAECGVENADPALIAAAFKTVKAAKPAFFVYFQSPGTLKTPLVSDASFAAYKAGRSA